MICEVRISDKLSFRLRPATRGSTDVLLSFSRTSGARVAVPASADAWEVLETAASVAAGASDMADRTAPSDKSKQNQVNPQDRDYRFQHQPRQTVR